MSGRHGEVTLPWADGEYTFRLAIGQWRELQEKTGLGPAALLTRLASRNWFIDDLGETIRLGLIGGGTNPIAAKKLIDRYVYDRPLEESVFPAVRILEAGIFGPEEEPVGKEVAAETPASGQTEGSASPPSTEPG